MRDLSTYFSAVAAKILTSVDADPGRSNQHEFGGLIKAGFGELLGDPGESTWHFDADFLFFHDDLSEPLADQGTVSWYDARRGGAFSPFGSVL